MKNFGEGPLLKDAMPWLKDSTERHRQILDVAERNSVIEGLPPFDHETRQRILERLRQLSQTVPPPMPSL